MPSEAINSASVRSTLTASTGAESRPASHSSTPPSSGADKAVGMRSIVGMTGVTRELKSALAALFSGLAVTAGLFVLL